MESIAYLGTAGLALRHQSHVGSDHGLLSLRLNVLLFGWNELTNVASGSMTD